MKKNYQKPSVKVVRIHTIQMIAQSPYAHEAVGQTGVQFSRGSSDNDWEEED
ncbi:MAG: hypothetical protein IJ887_09395 [Prevotella sp.]|nr:hypothetical protein [Prevotella sp.]